MPNWEKVGGDNLTPVWDYKDPNNKEFVGKFVETKTIQKADGKSSLLHEFETADGPMSIWGNFLIDTRLKDVVPGTSCKIVYLGKVPSKKNPSQTYHNFEFYKDTDSVPEEDSEELSDEDLDSIGEDIK